MHQSIFAFGLSWIILGSLSLISPTQAQPPDSISIADFFHPKNLAAINEISKDSLLGWVKKDEKLIDIYRFHEARLYLQTGRFDEAMEKAKEGMSQIPGSFPPYSKAKYLNIIGSVHANRQESQEAIQNFEQALRLSEEAKEEQNAALMLSNIANMYFSLVDYESAYTYISKAYEIMKNHPDHPFYSSLVAVLSISEAKVGRMNEAKIHAQLALEKAELSNSIVAIIIANLALGEVANSEKQFTEAKDHLSTSLELSEKYQQRPFVILNSIGLMAAHLGTNDYSQAVEHGEKALSLVNQGGDKTTLYSIKKNLAEAYFGVNQPEKAYKMMRESHEVFRDKNSIENKKAINDILLEIRYRKKGESAGSK